MKYATKRMQTNNINKALRLISCVHVDKFLLISEHAEANCKPYKLSTIKH